MKNLFSSKREGSKEKRRDYFYPPILTYDFTWTNRLEDRKSIRRNVSKDLLWILLFGKPGRMVKGGRYNSISSRWPPIKADEWEPFNGPSVNLHPWPYTFLPPLFNPFQHPRPILHLWNKEHSCLSRRHLLSVTRVPAGERCP